jgi:uncharacterized protein DUF3300
MHVRRVASARFALLLLCWPFDFLLAQDGAVTQPTFKPEELEQLVAPIALYPDSLLAQVLMASTYPLEVVEAARWSKDNPTVTGEAVEDAMQSQDWDPAVKSLTAFPEVLAMMNEKLDWTQKLGDAFLAQQSEIMSAVQRLRAKAEAEGTLKSTKEQKVTSETVAVAAAPAAAAAPASADPNAAPPASAAAPATNTTVIKIEPTDPQVVYVPTYNPTVVYGAWPYPAYPPYYYYPPGYAAGAAFFSFSVGVVVGSALWGNCNWGYGDVDINVNNYNNFNRTDINNDINRGDRGNVGNNAGNTARNNAGVSDNARGGSSWNHDPSHRKGVQYRDNATQARYGKGRDTAQVQSREAFRGHAEQGRQDLARGGATQDLAGNNLGGREAAGGARPDAGNLNTNQRPSQTGTGARSDAGNLSTNQRAGQTGTGAANRSSSAGSSSRTPDAYRGMNNSSATRSNSARGMSSGAAGGFSRGGGGGGGGRRR